MKLHALELEQFRKFDGAVRLAGFTDSLNLLCGPNEFGKSTILAAVRGLLFERHNSRAEPIKSMQPRRGNAAPRLAMEFEIGSGRWRIEKRFLHQPMARLTAPDGGRFDGEAAEEELQRLLGFGAAGKRGAGPEHMGVWGALWVTQRDSVHQADLSSELARATITSCLDTEVGVLTGSEKGQALMRAARAELAHLLDGNGKPKARYKHVVTAIAELDGRLAELRDRARRLNEDAEALRSNTDQLVKATDPAAEKREQEALGDARRRKEAALLYLKRLEAAQAAYASARRHRDEAERERNARAERAIAIVASEAALAKAGKRVESTRQAVEQAELALVKCREAAIAAQSRASTAQQAARRQRDVAELVRRAAMLAAYAAAVEQAQAVQQSVTELTARLDAIRIDKLRIAAVRKAAREQQTVRSILDAQATRIDFQLLPDMVERVSVEGIPLKSAHASIAVAVDTDIAVAGLGLLRVRPAIRDRDKLLHSIDAAEEALRTALAEAGCADPDDAERRWTERDIVERELREGRADLARLTPGDAAIGLAPGLGPLCEHVAVLRRRLERERTASGLLDIPPQERAASDLRAAEEEEIAAAEVLMQARAEIELAGDNAGEARVALARAEAESKAAAVELARLRGEAAQAEAREPDSALAARLAQAEARCAAFGAELADLERDRPVDTPEGMQTRIERYERVLAERQQTVRQLREEMAALRARIAQEGGHGLDEQIAALEREQDALGRERDRIGREVRVLQLLLDALSTAEREAKERYLAPVVRRVTPYLRSLFPGADVACDDTLRITGLTREHIGTEEFDRLSDGTQEQIAVLARLAFAEMLIDQGKPAMVILDDALAYSDGERMERMFDILTQASAKMQILILTCREDLFARLGGNRVHMAVLDRVLA